MTTTISKTYEDIPVISVSGQLIGGEEIDDLRGTLKEMIRQEQRNLIIDLGGVSFANSTAIGVLMSTNTSYKRRGWKLALCNLGKEVNVIITVTKLNLVFDIYDTREEALAGLRDQ